MYGADAFNLEPVHALRVCHLYHIIDILHKTHTQL